MRDPVLKLPAADVSVLDGYCSATGKSRTDISGGRSSKDWSEKKLHEATFDLSRCRGQSGGVGIWPESGRMTRPKNPPKRPSCLRSGPWCCEHPSCADRKLCWQQPIAQAIFDARTSAEARRSLMPGEGCELWAGALEFAPSTRARLLRRSAICRERMAA